MRRVPEYCKKPITFKQAMLTTLIIHLFGAACVGIFLHEKQTAKPKPLKTTVSSSPIGPKSDALDLNWNRLRDKTFLSLFNDEPLNQTSFKKVDVKVPTRPSEYTLRPGDNFYTVSKKLNISFSKLAKYNNIKDFKTLKVGQVLKVPQDS